MARLTLGFSKKEENHDYSFALHARHFNYVRPHGTLSKRDGKPTTPAMAPGLDSKPWTVEQIIQRSEAIFVL